MQRHTIVMMCGEDDPLDCHRGLMITPALGAQGVQPVHLRKDGSRETTPAMEVRLMEATKIGAGLLDGLFAAQVSHEERQEMLAEAYRCMNRKKAYRYQEEEDRL
jgi:hypothetical protein